MKICVIGTVGVPGCYGGFETLAERLIEFKSAEFTVYCSGKHYQEQPEMYNNARLIYIPCDANGASSVAYDVVSMIHALIIGHRNFLVLGVAGAIFFPILTCFSKVTIVTNIDGIEWRREKWGSSYLAKCFLKFSEGLAVRFSTQVVSDNDAVTRYVADEYKVECKTIAYGGDHAVLPAGSLNLDDSCEYKPPFALAICRVEPENNVTLILDAFSKTEFRIVFVGNWSASHYGMKLKGLYQSHSNITLLDPIYCIDELYRLRASCSLYVHGHSAGGTNPSLVEMMHFAKPIIAFDCSFNRVTMEDMGDYFCSSDELAEMLRQPSLPESGEALLAIANRRYIWEIIRNEYVELFKV